MSEAVHWLLELSIRPGKLEDFFGVMNEMIASTKSEAGTLIYEWCFNKDQTVCNIYERFADSEAALDHLDAFGSSAERFLTAVEPQKLTVLGDPNDKLRRALAGLSPVYYQKMGGFTR